MCPPSQALHLPVPFGEQKPCHNQIICVTNFDGEERKRVKQLITSLGAKYTGYLTHTNSVLICKKPDGVKYKKAKEWKIPVVNVQWLTDLLCGYLDALRLPLNQKYKIPNLVNPFILNTELVSRLLVSNTSAVLFTGFSSVITKQLHKIADHLGLSVVQNAKDCSHVIIPSLSRTIKLFEAISVCKYILTRQWLDDSLDQAKLLDEEKYMLKDTKNEKEFSCCIIDSLHRAQIKPLFQGMTFYITPSVVPSTKDLTRIISNAGGTVVNRRPSAKTILTQLDDKGKPTFIVITCNNDLHLCRDLFAQKINVYNAEFVLTGVLRQEIDYTMFTITIPT
ncbi:hypothetical protein LOTGIDRAFT_236998 [Lottia gigantea]|uniref:PAX-interacting protein 1 n=1 Tax=Lottia gigantea TaxID=225164 RepID=V3ZJ70_LOTGI|nr:hypothetical protein LOTGIDRAFT_236998 [Lottia gigantea]ESO82380.1 hypothetical protein LOTGIDRAFT_236998 [Lottia gigantea]